MSDFFSTIAARSLSATPQVTPRLPTLFEPDRASSRELEELAFEPEAPRAVLPAPGVAAPSPSVTALRAPAVQLAAQRSLPAQAARLPAAPIAPLASHQEQIPTALPQPDAPRLPARAALDPPHAHAPSQVIEQAAARDHVRSAPVEPAPAHPRPVADLLATLLPRSVQPTQPVVVPAVPRRDAATQLAPLTPLRESPVKPLTRRTAPEAAPALPTIQVTIGRIEVRAAAPDRPARPERSTAAVMSLDDYLRQRDGGRR